MNKFIYQSKRFLEKNAPTILTAIGGAGVVATTVTAVKATPKAIDILEEAKNAKGEELTTLEIVRVAAPVYIPSILLGVSTIACIFGANALNKRQQAALMSAYALANTTFKEYKSKVQELYGEEADTKVKNEIAKDKYEKVDSPKNDGLELFFDEFSGRFFRSTLAEVQRAEYDLNRDLTMQEWATINNFYDHLKIPPVAGGDIIGWSTPMNGEMYWQTWVDFSNVKMVDDDGLEYYIVRMFQEPMPDFESFIG